MVHYGKKKKRLDLSIYLSCTLHLQYSEQYYILKFLFHSWISYLKNYLVAKYLHH